MTLFVCVILSLLLTVHCVLIQEYGTTLESDIKGDTSGDFEDLLLGLLKVREAIELLLMVDGWLS
jgi:hypothetical protein